MSISNHATINKGIYDFVWSCYNRSVPKYVDNIDSYYYLFCGKDTVGIIHKLNWKNNPEIIYSLDIFNYHIIYSSRRVYSINSFYEDYTEYRHSTQPSKMSDRLYYDWAYSCMCSDTVLMDTISNLKNGTGYTVSKYSNYPLNYIYYQNGLRTGREESKNDRLEIISIRDYFDEEKSIFYSIEYESGRIHSLYYFKNTKTMKLGLEYTFGSNGHLQGVKWNESSECSRLKLWRIKRQLKRVDVNTLDEQKLIYTFPMNM